MGDSAEQQIIFGFSIVGTLYLGMAIGYNSYKIYKTNKKIKKLQTYQQILRQANLTKWEEIQQGLTRELQNGERKLVFVYGVAAKEINGRSNSTGQQDSMVLIRNEYMRKNIFNNYKEIYSNNQLFNFYLTKNNQSDGLYIQPSGFTHLQFDDRKRSHKERNQSPILSRMLLGLGSIAFYDKFTSVIYQGDTVCCLGLVRYNQLADRWEMDKVIAMFLDDFNQLLNYKNSLSSQIVRLKLKQSAMVAFQVGLFYLSYLIGKKLLRIFKNSISKKINRFRQKRRQQQLIDQQDSPQPPIVNKHVDSIHIDDFVCITCRKETRELIMLPCNDCYTCQKCYQNKEDKFKCDRCGKKIEELVRIYTSANE